MDQEGQCAPRCPSNVVDHRRRIERECDLWAAVDRGVTETMTRKAQAMVLNGTTPKLHVDQCVKEPYCLRLGRFDVSRE